MDCLTFLDRLAALLDGTATAAERASAEAHTASCAGCREILQAAQAGNRSGEAETHRTLPTSSQGLAASLPDDLVETVLARTTGSVCGRAESLLCDYVDGLLDEAAASMLGAHLERCVSCSALAGALQAVNRTLASFAEVEPPPDLLPAVLDATSRRPKRGWLVGLAAAWSEALLSRPRFSLEAAYAGTLVLLLVFGNPAARLQAASERTATLARTGVSRVREALPGTLAAISARGDQQVSAAVATLDAVEETLAGPRQVLERTAGSWWQSATARWSGTWNEARGVVGLLLAEMSARFSRVREAIQSVLPARTEPPRRPGR